jgi:hypothetical protein
MANREETASDNSHRPVTDGQKIYSAQDGWRGKHLGIRLVPGRGVVLFIETSLFKNARGTVGMAFLSISIVLKDGKIISSIHPFGQARKECPGQLAVYNGVVLFYAKIVYKCNFVADAEPPVWNCTAPTAEC